MNELSAGFAQLDVTPSLGIRVHGYYQERISDGVLDPLMVRALALRVKDRTVVLLSADVGGFHAAYSLSVRREISEKTGLPMEAIYLHGTHTHTGPELEAVEGERETEYLSLLKKKLCDVAYLAMEDLKPAKMGWGIGSAPNIAFVRRFLMKDGSIRTNPGVGNPDILRPVGEVDERVNVLRFDREGGKTLVLVNFGNHPDVVGGTKFSADWPGLLCHQVEKALDNTACIFFNGAQGDVNHVNVHPTGGFLNGTFHDFDDVSRGYPHAIYMARVVLGGVLQAFDKVKYVDVDTLSFAQKEIQAPSQRPRPEEVPEALRIHELHTSGRDDLIPYEGMMLTTVVAEAARMVQLKDGPDFFPMTLSAIRVGPVCFAGIPGEPFTGIGRALKETEGYELVCPTCITNGYEGYFPMMNCYEEGGYESRSAPFAPGIAELIIRESQALIQTLL